MKRIYKDQHTKANVNVLPITYPFAKRVAALDINPYKAHCCCDKPKQTRDNSSIMGAPKIEPRAQQQKFLKRYSKHIPVSMKYEKGKKEAMPIRVLDAQPKPLTAAEQEVRHICLCPPVNRAPSGTLSALLIACKLCYTLVSSLRPPFFVNNKT
jgi:hypothetical protein